MKLTPIQRDFLTRLRVAPYPKNTAHGREDSTITAAFNKYEQREQSLLIAIKDLEQYPPTKGLVAGFEAETKKVQERVKVTVRERATSVVTAAEQTLEEIEKRVLAALQVQITAGKEWLAMKTRRDGAVEKIGAIETLGATEVPRLRYEFKFANEKGARKDCPAAIADFTNLEGRINTLHTSYTTDPSRKKWAAQDGNYISVQGKIEELEEFVEEGEAPDTGVAPHVNSLAVLKQDVRDGRFGDAIGHLATLKPKVDAMHGKIAAVMRHRVELSKNEDRIASAKAVPAGPAVDAAIGEMTVAKAAAKAADNLSKAQLLDGLRQTYLQKVDAVLNAYAGSSPDQTADSWMKVEYYRYRGAELVTAQKKARPLEEITPAIATLKQQLGALVLDAENEAGADQWANALAQAQAAVAKSVELGEAHKRLNRAAKAFYVRYRKHEAQIAGMKGKVESWPLPRSTVQTAFLTAVGELNTERVLPAPDYQKCMKILAGKVEPALKTVLAEHVETLKQGVAAANSGPLANDFIEQREPWELKALPSAQQVALLKKSRETWPLPGTKQEHKKRRELQCKVYRNMEMDEEFLAHDREKRQQLVDAVKRAPEFKEAKANWKNPTMTWEQKKAILQKLANEQCKAFGFDPVPVIKLADIGGNESGVTNGYFDPNTKSIVINTNSYSSANEFEEALDLIAHENSHYYQDQLCKGLIDPAKLDPRLKAQVELFKVNDDPGNAYVPPGEDFATYQVQPLELHAHLAGPETARGIVAYLDSEEVEGIDLSQIGKL